MGSHARKKGLLARWWWRLLGFGVLALIVIYGLQGHSKPVPPVQPVQSPVSTQVRTPQPRTEPAKTPPPIATVQSYKVVSGDTLTGIAQSHCGNPGDWAKLASGNKIANPAVLTPGEIIVLTC
jgi:nucleoid-associated protein YgaU